MTGQWYRERCPDGTDLGHMLGQRLMHIGCPSRPQRWSGWRRRADTGRLHASPATLIYRICGTGEKFGHHFDVDGVTVTGGGHDV